MREGLVVFFYITLYAFSVALCAINGGVLLAAMTTIFVPVSLLAVEWLLNGRTYYVNAIYIVILSSIQNVILGICAKQMSSLQTKILFGQGILTLFCFLIFKFALDSKRYLATKIRFCSLLLIIFLIVVGMDLVLFGFSGISTFASFRNLVGPFVVLILGYMVADEGVKIDRLALLVATIGVIVVFIGVYELYFDPDMWRRLNIAALWEKKGLTNLGENGFPRGWIPAEPIMGSYPRRMVSTFADPLNLGAFLFSAFMAAWYLNRRYFMVVILLGMGLVISKAALLGLLIFLVVYGYYKMSKNAFIAITASAVGAGIGFIVYSVRFATGSMLLHIAGFANAVVTLPAHPLGIGVGNVGSLSLQFSERVDTDILESGFGMISGQTGLPGVIIYLILFFWIAKSLKKLEIREKILGYSLHFAIFSNALFNEVALSLNSNSTYFLMLGMLILRGSMRSITSVVESKRI